MKFISLLIIFFYLKWIVLLSNNKTSRKYCIMDDIKNNLKSQQKLTKISAIIILSLEVIFFIIDKTSSLYFVLKLYHNQLKLSIVFNKNIAHEKGIFTQVFCAILTRTNVRIDRVALWEKMENFPLSYTHKIFLGVHSFHIVFHIIHSN